MGSNRYPSRHHPFLQPKPQPQPLASLGPLSVRPLGVAARPPLRRAWASSCAGNTPAKSINTANTPTKETLLRQCCRPRTHGLSEFISPTITLFRQFVNGLNNRLRKWSERRDSNPRHRPWQGRALPSELRSRIPPGVGVAGQPPKMAARGQFGPVRGNCQAQGARGCARCWARAQSAHRPDAWRSRR